MGPPEGEILAFVIVSQNKLIKQYEICLKF